MVTVGEQTKDMEGAVSNLAEAFFRGFMLALAMPPSMPTGKGGSA